MAIKISGSTIIDDSRNIVNAGVITATSFSGDGSNLSGVVSGIEVFQAGSSVGTSITAINFASGATLTGGSGFSTVTIASAGISTAKSIGFSFYLGY